MNTTAPTNQEFQFSITGMTCAACAGRIERVLAKAPGVTTVSVNLATELAQVHAVAPASAEQLQQTIERAGYGAMLMDPDADKAQRTSVQQSAHRQHERVLRQRMLWALALAAPVFILEMGSHAFDAVHHWVHGTLGETVSWRLQWVLTTAVMLGPGRAFFVQGWKALRALSPDMNSLVAIGAAAAWAYSSVATWRPEVLSDADRFVYFEAAAVVIALVLMGKWLEAKAKSRTSQAIAGLVELQPAHAWKLGVDGAVHEVPLAAVRVGDVLELRPGERVAVDGLVIEGQSMLNESMLTGEPMPVHKTVGTAVCAGTVNREGSLRYRATAVGRDTALAAIVAAVERAQTGKLPVQDKVDAITRVFVPVVLVLALFTFLAWWALGPETEHGRALVYAVAVLVIACPCAMGLATPTSILVGSGRAASEGVLFRDATALQRLGEVRCVVFDKTGTLTQGQPIVTQVWAPAAHSTKDVLRLAASLEARSEHPLALAIVGEADRQGIALDAVTEFSAVVGLGAQGRVAEQLVRVGASTWLEGSMHHTIPEVADALAQGQTVVWVEAGGEVIGAIALFDTAREQAAGVIQALHRSGVRTVMITGDDATTAGAVASTLGIQDVRARVTPVDKAAMVAALQNQYGSTAFVGDGINDAPALAQADVGVAVGHGADVAIETADVVLVGARLDALVQAIAGSRATLRNIYQNLGWAFAYNAVLIPVAAGLLVPFGGPSLSPVLAAAAMALSSVFVLGNALRLRKLRWDIG